jgi:hypothetical protein
MLASGDGVGKGRHVTPPPDLEVESGLRQLSERLKVIVISLLIGALVALATVAFFEIVSAANAFWAVPLPHGLYQIAWDYSVTVGFVLLASALVAGQILLRLDRGQPQGPAELIDCA